MNTEDEQLEPVGDRRNGYVTRHQALSIAEEGGRAAAVEIATRVFGMDMDNPEKVREVQHIWDWAKDKRSNEKANRKKAVMVGIGFIVITIGNWLIDGFDAIVKVLGHG